MRSHLVVLTSEMYMSNTWHLTLELSLKLYRVKDYTLYEVWRLLTSILFYYAGYISSKEPTEKETKKKTSRTLRSSTKSETKAALSECHVKGLARQHGFYSSTNR